MPVRITFNAYAGSASIFSQMMNPSDEFDATVFAGVASDAGITRAEWLGGNTGFFGVDNVLYGSVVPTLSAAWLFGSALSGLAPLARARKAR